MIKILIADDHYLMIDGIKSTLSDIADFKIVAEATSGLDVLEYLASNKVDIILMDINMPLMDGLECTKIVTEKFPGTKVIALSQYGESRFIKRMIKNGSSGYLLKDAHKDELVTAIRKVHKGKKYYGSSLQNIYFNLQQNISYKKSNIPKLTKREKEILTLICNEFSTHEIAIQLSISHNTAEHHRANLIKKSNSKNTAGLVRWAVENNLISN